MTKLSPFKSIACLGVASLMAFSSCKDKTTDPQPEPDKAGFLASNVDALGTIDLGSFTIPTTYVESGATTGSFAPAKYSGQLTRRAQLAEIVSYTRNEPITFDIEAALADGSLFTTVAAQSSSTNIRTKIDELNFDGADGRTVDQSVADAFAALADSLVSSSANYAVTAAEGTAGMITTGTKKRHVSANGLEYAQILEKGLFGPLFYNQMVDDYLRPSQSGIDNSAGNNESGAGSDYAAEGTGRQHAFDEAFGYFGAPINYPIASETKDGGGEFLANYIFDFSDETEEVYGINLSKKIARAFIVGRSALKAGEGVLATDESTNEAVYNAARADIKLYVEAGIAAAAFHYLNESIDDVDDADKLHHLSEALGFIYSLSFNSEGRVTSDEAYAALIELGWPANNKTLTGIYEINLYDVTDEKLKAAKTSLDASLPGFANVKF